MATGGQIAGSNKAHNESVKKIDLIFSAFCRNKLRFLWRVEIQFWGKQVTDSPGALGEYDRQVSVYVLTAFRVVFPQNTTAFIGE